jgi:hypothetical protein
LLAQGRYADAARYSQEIQARFQGLYYREGVASGMVQEMIRSVLSGDAALARTIGNELGLDEAKFVAKGGGLPVAVVVIAVACALLLASDNPQ